MHGGYKATMHRSFPLSPPASLPLPAGWIGPLFHSQPREKPHVDPTHMVHPTEERGRQEWIAVPRSRERQIEPFIRSGNTKCGVETWSGGARRTGGSQQLAAAHHGVAAAGTGPARCRGPSVSAENHGSRGAPLLACLLLRLGTVGVCRRGWGSWLLLLLHRTRSRTQRGLAGTVGED